MLARANRLTRADEYRSTVRRGRRFVGRLVIVSRLRRDEVPARFGFIVSKKVGNAVARNTVRRRLKAICLEALPAVPQGTAVVVRALPTAAAADFDALRVDVLTALGLLEQPA